MLAASRAAAQPAVPRIGFLDSSPASRERQLWLHDGMKALGYREGRELLRKRLDLLGELVPGLKRVAVMSNSGDAKASCRSCIRCARR
jgi:hypothetical protein